MIFSSPHTVDLRRHTSELRTHSADERFGSNLVLFRLGKHDFGVGIDVAGGIIFLVKLSQLLGHGLEGERLFDVLPPCISCRIRHEAEQACGAQPVAHSRGDGQRGCSSGRPGSAAQFLESVSDLKSGVDCDQVRNSLVIFTGGRL